jgi:hypothetical protein
MNLKDSLKRPGNKEVLVAVSIIVVLMVILGIVGYKIGNSINYTKGFNDGYAESCKYKVPDGCSTCTTDEAVKGFCLKGTTPEYQRQCIIAQKMQKDGNEIRILLYDGNRSGVILR